MIWSSVQSLAAATVGLGLALGLALVLALADADGLADADALGEGVVVAGVHALSTSNDDTATDRARILRMGTP